MLTYLGCIITNYIHFVVEVIDENPFIKSQASGGVFLRDLYLLGKTKFLWTDKRNGRAGITINGKGLARCQLHHVITYFLFIYWTNSEYYSFPLEAVKYFYNTKYITFKNSLNYRDGLATVIFPITTVSFLFIPMIENVIVLRNILFWKC